MQEVKQQWSHSMEKIKYILMGAGGHARVVASAIEVMKQEVVCVFDPNTSITDLDGIQNKGDSSPTEFPTAKLILTIGDNATRKRLATTVQHEFGTVQHPAAIVDRLVSVGLGSQILHGAIINRGSSVGNHCIVNTKASIDHDCIIEDFVHIAPGATLCGNVTVGEGTLIGAGATLMPNITIGKNVTVGAATVVTTSLPDNVTCVGVPGKIINNG